MPLATPKLKHYQQRVLFIKMAVFQGHAMLRGLRTLPHAAFLPNMLPLFRPSTWESDCSAATAGHPTSQSVFDWNDANTADLNSFTKPIDFSTPCRGLPYWLGAERRLMIRPVPLESSSAKSCRLRLHDGISGAGSGANAPSGDPTAGLVKGLEGRRPFGSQAGALQHEEEELPRWRKQEGSKDGFITDGMSSQTFGGSSKCRSISFGCATMQGRKETMDDRLAVQFSVRGNRHLGFFGAYDGHGGWTVADYAAHKLHRHLLNSPVVGTSLVQAIADAYARTDEEVLTYPGRLPGEYGPGLVGSTATTALVDLGRGQLVVGNVGDSRAVLCSGGRAVRLTAEHTVAEDSERERIERGGGEVLGNRLCGILNVSRALGDSDMKQWVISAPFVREVQLTSQDDFMVLATDGLWDVMSNEGAVEVAGEAGDARRGAEMLLEEAMMRRAKDDVACLVVYFHWAR